MLHSKKKLKLYVFIMLFNMFFSNAYIDPGSGGMIIGSLWSTIVGFFGLIIGFLGIYFFKPIKKFFKNVFKRKQ
jgi:hypothetical protein